MGWAEVWTVFIGRLLNHSADKGKEAAVSFEASGKTSRSLRGPLGASWGTLFPFGLTSHPALPGKGVSPPGLPSPRATEQQGWAQAHSL